MLTFLFLSFRDVCLSRDCSVVLSSKITKEDAGVETEKTTEVQPPVLVRNETEDSVEIICDVLE